VEPEYPTCKIARLCDLVDVGLLRFHLNCSSLQEYVDAHELLLRGAREMQLLKAHPFPSNAEAFVEAVLEAHRCLFRHVFPLTAGRFREPAASDFDVTVFGGDRKHQRQGWDPEHIQEGVEHAFSYATSNALTPVGRSAAFLAHFLRVHPFTDGNGRIGRLFVERICSDAGIVLGPWSNDGKGRRRYIRALETAHACHTHHGHASNAKLAAWIQTHVVGSFTPDDEDPV
jgi:fido (protein-threonine AMPylation protein)